MLYSGTEWFISACSNTRQVCPRQRKWDEVTLLLSLAGFRASSWADLLPPSHWCQMNDEHLDMKSTTTRQFIALFSFLFYVWPPSTERTVRYREKCNLNCAHICQTSQSVCDLLCPVCLQSYNQCPLSDDFMREYGLLMDRSIEWRQ